MIKSLKNKNILIVGANGSLAKETIKQLIKDGAQNISMACRTAYKGLEVRNDILKEYKTLDKSNLPVIGGFDMNNPNEIKKAVAVLPKDKPYDIVFLAAGFAVFTEDYDSIEWNGKTVEKNIFQNLIGSHITLTELKNKGLIAQNARVVIAGGEGARGIKGMIEKPEFKSAKEFREYVYLKNAPKYNPMNAIGVSKLCGALWTKKIAEIEGENMEVIWFSPGLTSKSAGLQNLPAAKRTMMSVMFGIMSLLGKSQSPVDGGRKNADCLIGKYGKSGDLLGAPSGKSIGDITDQTPLNSLFSNQSIIDELWTILEEVTGPYESKLPNKEEVLSQL